MSDNIMDCTDIFKYIGDLPIEEYIKFWDGFYLKNPEITDRMLMSWYKKSYQEWRDSVMNQQK